VRNNTIRRCGQSGIAGHRGAAGSIIEGNLVEDINYRSEFGGWETAATGHEIGAKPDRLGGKVGPTGPPRGS